MKNITRVALLLTAVIGFIPAKPVQANPHHGHRDYYVTHYYKPKPTYHKVYYYQPKPTYQKVYYHYQPKPTYHYYQPKKNSTHHKVHYYR